MILPDYLEKEVKKFCEIKKIPFRDGKVSPEHIVEVENFVNDRLRKDRAITKRQEEIKGMHIGSIIRKMTTGEEDKVTIEDYMRDALIKAKLYQHCKPQLEIGTKRVDFGFPIAHLAVECDGREYHFTEKWQIERDQKRDKYLAQKGWRVLHIEGLAIRRNIGLCIEKIEKALKPFL